MTNDEQFLKDLGVGHNDKITADDVGAFMTVVSAVLFVVFLILTLRSLS